MVESTLQGTPDIVLELMNSLASQISYQGAKYTVKRTSGRPDFSNWDKSYYISCIIYVSLYNEEHPIGKVSLRLLPKEQTRFNVSKVQVKETVLINPVTAPLFASSDELLEHFLMALWEKFEHGGFTGSYEKERASDTQQPKAFIAHGGGFRSLTRLKDFLHALGVEPLVVEEQPSEGRQIDEQVDKYFKEADCEIVLATYGEIVDQKTGVRHPRLNVIDELRRGIERFPKRVILLLEKDVELPTNDSGIIYEIFTKDNMTDAFIKVARELTTFGILKAAKPAEKKANA